MANDNSTLSKDYLLEHLEYSDGLLFWKKSQSGRFLRKQAGWIDAAGYYKIAIKCKTYSAHRIIYFMFYGFMPNCVDHIDCDPSNNKIENLRAASFAQNSWNQGVRKNNILGIKGVSWREKNGKYAARCMVNYKSHFVGLYNTIPEAVDALKMFRASNHGEFAKH